MLRVTAMEILTPMTASGREPNYLNALALCAAVAAFRERQQSGGSMVPEDSSL
jgi:hypothetical protein